MKFAVFFNSVLELSVSFVKICLVIAKYVNTFPPALPTFTVRFCEIVLKMSAHTLLLNVCEFRENRRTEGRALLTGAK